MDEESKAALVDATGAATRLRRMLGNLLDITKLETGTMVLDRRPHDAATLLGAVARAARGVAREQGVTVLVEPVLDSLPAQFDHQVVRRALDNLVDNALRYAPKGSAVRLHGRLEQEMLVLEVADDGPGIPDELRERIFEAYARLAPPEGSSDFNHGLGLTFVRLAAFAHGGTASVASGPGRGSVFRITLPAA